MTWLIPSTSSCWDCIWLLLLLSFEKRLPRRLPLGIRERSKHQYWQQENFMLPLFGPLCLCPLQTTYKRQDSHPGMQSTSNIFFGWLQAWDWDKVRMFHQKSKPLTFQSEKDINVNFVTKHLLLLWDPGACVMLLCRHIWIKNQEVMQSNRVLS